MIAVQHDAVALRYSIRMIRLCVLHTIQTLQKKLLIWGAFDTQFCPWWQSLSLTNYKHTHAYNFARNRCSITENFPKLWRLHRVRKKKVPLDFLP